MAKSRNIKQFAGQRLRELFARATAWQEHPDFRIGSQTVDLLVRFKMGTAESTLIVESSSVGQPRQIRETIARLADARRELPVAYPIVVADYVSPQSAALLKRSGADVFTSEGGGRAGYLGEPKAQFLREKRLEAAAVAVGGIERVVVGPGHGPVVAVMGLS